MISLKSNTFRIITLGFILSLFFTSCKDKSTTEPLIYNPAFNQYISGYTDFEISRTTPLLVRFVEDGTTNEMVGEETSGDIASISPNVKGTFKWADTKTLQFTPEKNLESGKGFTISVELSDIFKDVPDSLSTFKFAVNTKKQAFSLDYQGLAPSSSEDISSQKFVGEIKTVDYEELEKVKENVSASLVGETKAINWAEPQNGNTVFPFVIENIKREEDAQTLAIGIEKALAEDPDFAISSFTVPAKGSFLLLSHKVVSFPEKYVVLEYSDPLDPKQNLNGLITLGKVAFTTSIEENKIKIFPKTNTKETIKLTVASKVRNVLGDVCKERGDFQVSFIDHDPEVKLLGNGTITPQGNTLPLPFEAINLSAVDLRVIKISENNIQQFLQVNNISGSYQLKRVGEVVARKTIKLDPKLNLKEKNEHLLDLSKIVKTEPGALYRVALGFRPSYSLYSCEKMDTAGGNKMLQVDRDWETETEYDDYYYEEDDDYYYYSWRDRKDPCKAAYYNKNRTAEKNILASNIGLIAKKGIKNDLYLVATDLKTTSAMSGVTFEVYNYQQRLLSTFTSGNDGMAKGEVKGNPYLLIAKKGDQRGYLRLDNGNANSISNFDVSGATYQKGLNGFIYGERGVWRPGDDIFLTFILEDKEKTLPAQHPVSLEFINPKGQTVESITSKSGLNGFYHFKLKTGQESPTGSYHVKITAGGRTFYKYISVETIQPNRLKINLDMQGESIVAGENQQATLNSKWLHGATAKNLKADVRVSLATTSTSFKGYGDYQFTYDSYGYSSSEELLFDGKLDEQGNASFPLTFNTNGDIPGKMKARFNVKVFEPGGNFSVDAFSMDYHPYQGYTGIRTPKKGRYQYYYPTDKDLRIDLATVNTNGKPISGSSAVDVQVYKLDWRWWWDDGMDRIGYYSKNSRNLKLDEEVTLSNGLGHFKFKADYDNWGRYLIIAENEFGHKSGKIIYVDWPNSNRSADANKGGAKMLTFTADKPEYNAGDEIILNIPTPKKGKILVSIESGQKVLEQHWLESNGETSKFKLKATKEMAPACYAYVTLIQPHGNTENDLPIRMYGLIPLKVTDPLSKLKPELSMPAVLAPLSTVEIDVSETEGRAMTYTIAMVDEGLLDLTRYKTPDVWSNFNKKQALRIRTWDNFDDVTTAEFDKIKNLLSIGGGAGSDSKDDTKKANRFKPMVYYAGPFYLPAGQKKTHRINIPNYIGSVKTMVVAGGNFSYGNTEKVTPVRKPLMVLGTLPRVVSPGERIKFPITTFVMDNKIKNVTLSIEPNEFLINQGAKSKQLSFSEQGDQQSDFDIVVAEKQGIAKVKVIAMSGSERSVFEVELDVRSPNPPTVDLTNTSLSQGKSLNEKVTSFGIDGSNSVSVTIASTLPINLDDRLDYLIRYPYGCIEQTTSSVFPQVYLKNLVPLTNKEKQEIENNVKDGIKRLSLFQTNAGGFAYWPGNTYSNEWGSNYAGHFLLEAKNAGFYVPSSMLKSWKKYQKDMARSYRRTDRWYNDMTQAYRLYSLAKAGSPELGAMNKLKTGSLSEKAKWYLAGAYYLAGQRTIGKNLIKSLTTSVKDYQQFGQTFGSSTRDKAIILEVLTLMKSEQEAQALASEISKLLSDNKRWMSTQTTAYSLIAMAKYLEKFPKPDALQAEVTINGKTTTVDTKENMYKINIDNPSATTNIKVVNKSNGSLYTTILNRGVSKVDKATDGSNLMSLDVKYIDMEGRAINPLELEQGTDFKMVVTVMNKSSLFLEQVALNTMMPSGWEIHNSRMTGVSSGTNSSFDYQDIRDDRVYTFFDLRKYSSKTYTFSLNASYLGQYFQPSIMVAPMYDESIYARKSGRIVKVVPQE